MTVPDTTTARLSKEPPVYTHAAKVIVVGEATVGKTSLIVRFVKGIFKPSYILTIGVNFYVQDIYLPNRVLRLQIWDTAGQERFGPIRRRYYFGTKGAVLVYDKSSEETFQRLEYWLKEISQHAGDIPVILVGNKADLKEIISFERGKQFAMAHRLTFLEASAKTGHQTVRLFNLLAFQVSNYLSRHY